MQRKYLINPEEERNNGDTSMQSRFLLSLQSRGKMKIPNIRANFRRSLQVCRQSRGRMSTHDAAQVLEKAFRS